MVNIATLVLTAACMAAMSLWYGSLGMNFAPWKHLEVVGVHMTLSLLFGTMSMLPIAYSLSKHRSSKAQLYVASGIALGLIGAGLLLFSLKDDKVSFTLSYLVQVIGSFIVFGGLYGVVFCGIRNFIVRRLAAGNDT